MAINMTNQVLQALQTAMEGLTQKAIAEKAGVTEATVSEIITGKRSPRLDTIEKLLKAADELKKAP